MPIQNTPITNATALNDLILCAKNEVNNLLTGEEFLVKDLFLGYEWSRIATGNRTRLGSAFFAYAQGDGRVLLVPLGKTPQNQQRYKKQ